VQAVAHHHGLGGGGALVEHRGVGDFEPGQVADHRLEVEERLEAALGDLGLVGGVGGVPAGVFKDGPLDDGRDHGVVVAHPDEVAEDAVVGGDRPEFGQGGAFAGGRRQVERTAADVGRDGGVNQGVGARVAQLGQHGGGVGGGIPQVAAGESVVGGREVAKRGHAGKR